ncbi:hypothetical protein D3C85_837210 [compost metagenome]
MLAFVVEQRRLDFAGADHRHIDATQFLFGPQYFGQTHHAELGSGVGRLRVAADNPGQRRHEHQMPLGREVLEGTGGEVAAADQVDVDHLGEGGKRQLGEHTIAHQTGAIEGKVG